MILTYIIKKIPADRRAAYLACGTRESPTIITLDTSKPCFAALFQGLSKLTEDDSRVACARCGGPHDEIA